jgi:hypothetical protein
MTKKSPLKSPARKSTTLPKAPGEKTIARTLAKHQSDPSHKFHAPGQKKDGRLAVASGERLQRVRARAQAN